MVSSAAGMVGLIASGGIGAVLESIGSGGLGETTAVHLVSPGMGFIASGGTGAAELEFTFMGGGVGDSPSAVP